MKSKLLGVVAALAISAIVSPAYSSSFAYVYDYQNGTYINLGPGEGIPDEALEIAAGKKQQSGALYALLLLCLRSLTWVPEKGLGLRWRWKKDGSNAWGTIYDIHLSMASDIERTVQSRARTTRR